MFSARHLRRALDEFAHEEWTAGTCNGWWRRTSRRAARSRRVSAAAAAGARAATTGNPVGAGGTHPGRGSGGRDGSTA